MTNIYFYGPPGSGKTTAGRLLAQALGREFVDTDERIEAGAGMAVAEIFAQHGEARFRQLERETVREITARTGWVVSLGGGALLDPVSRMLAEASGKVIRLDCGPGELARRIGAMHTRPLVSGSDVQRRLEALLEGRAEHYRSFSQSIDTGGLSPEGVVTRAQQMIGLTRVKGMGDGYDAILRRGALQSISTELEARGHRPPFTVISDERVAQALSNRLTGLDASPITFPAGEGSKTLETVARLYSQLIARGFERGGTLIALGGGVVGDVGGFVAASIYRGVKWINVPTSLLAMVDSSLGGKVGVDLPEGKNLVGAFHPPSLVLADPEALDTLPREELVSGLAEVVKAGLIGDAELFTLLEEAGLGERGVMDEALFRSIQVKRKVIEADPYERGVRASLNLGHTVGHALEHESGYALRHGEAVAIGLVAEARLAEAIGLCEAGLGERVAALLKRLGLPTGAPTLDPRAVRERMARDKKTVAGRVLFALPETIGRVRVGVEAPDSILTVILQRTVEAE